MVEALGAGLSARDDTCSHAAALHTEKSEADARGPIFIEVHEG
jgi:hypothetical protein